MKILRIFLLVFVIYSCSDDEGFGDYYTGSFSDNLAFTVDSDSVNILFGMFDGERQSHLIPYSEQIDNSLSDSVKIKLFASYGSFTENPEPVKEIVQDRDTTFIWYSVFENMMKQLNKSNSLLKVGNNPKTEYIIIDSAVVFKNESKTVSLSTKIY